MTDAAPNVAQLNSEQQSALATYTAVTNQGHADAVALLQRSQWNVQVILPYKTPLQLSDVTQIAIAKFFDGEGPDLVEEARAAQASPPPPTTSPRRETLLNGFTTSPRTRTPAQNTPAPRIIPQPRDQGNYIPPAFLLILLTPFNLLTGLVGKTFSLIGFTLSFIPRLLPGLFVQRPSPRIRSGRRPLSPRDTAARFAREFEEDYGQHSLQFFDGGYATAYDLAKKELKYLLVVLLSPEHDDTSAFVRDVLLSPEVTNFVNSKGDLLIWAGNVQDSEAYQISSALNGSKFPFAALVAHAPQVSSTAMSTIARISGLTTPSSFTSQLQRAIEQHSPQLSRVRSQRNEQQASRNIRDEQNSAYERSLAQDRERVRQRREAEAAESRATEAARVQAESQAQEAQRKEQWQKWRAQNLSAEPAAEVKDASRVSIRLPSGERLIRKFSPSARIEEVYAFVECHEHLPSDDSTSASKPAGYRHKYEFRLVSPMPRVVYDADAGESVGEGIGRSANLIVESITEAEEDD